MTSSFAAPGKTDIIYAQYQAASAAEVADLAHKQMLTMVFSVKDTRGRYNIVNSSQVAFITVVDPNDPTERVGTPEQRPPRGL